MTTFITGDHLGSTSVLADSSGSLVARLRYDAWGVTRYSEGTLSTDYQFTGQRYQAILDLYDYGARWYDPGLGRFVSADTIVGSPGEPQGLDRFSYAGNDPVRHVDPTGHMYVPGTSVGQSAYYRPPVTPTPTPTPTPYGRYLQTRTPAPSPSSIGRTQTSTPATRTATPSATATPTATPTATATVTPAPAAAYTAEERSLARTLYGEQHSATCYQEERMTAVGYVAMHSMARGIGGHTTLEDTLENRFTHSPEPADANDASWLLALQVARSVLNGSAEDLYPWSLFCGDGDWGNPNDSVYNRVTYWSGGDTSQYALIPGESARKGCWNILVVTAFDYTPGVPTPTATRGALQ